MWHIQTYPISPVTDYKKLFTRGFGRHNRTEVGKVTFMYLLLHLGREAAEPSRLLVSSRARFHVEETPTYTLSHSSDMLRMAS